MAYDKVVDSAVLEAGLTLIGDSIRAKGGTNAKLEFPNGMKAAVEAIDTSEDLDDVMDEQDSIIDQIQTALEGKAGVSGPSVETCTVNIVLHSGGKILLYGYSFVTTDGEVRAVGIDLGSAIADTTISLENVVCGSLVYCNLANSYPYVTLDGLEYTDLQSSIKTLFLQAPTTANSIGTIDIIDDD